MIFISSHIDSILPFIMEVVVGFCCLATIKLRKRQKGSERMGAQELLDYPASRRGFIYSDVPGMEDKLVDLDEVVQGTDLTGMVLMHATGGSSSDVFQGQIVQASAGQSEADVFYCDNVATTPRAGTPTADVRTGCVLSHAAAGLLEKILLIRKATSQQLSYASQHLL